MRLWTLHPKYLDPKGLTALWREALLAQKVLQGKTKGYRHHPQLLRFKQCSSPLGAISRYLQIVAAEAKGRGYSFQENKIGQTQFQGKLKETRGQLFYEKQHLIKKLRQRYPKGAILFEKISRPQAHPLFKIVPGRISQYEKLAKPT